MQIKLTKLINSIGIKRILVLLVVSNIFTFGLYLNQRNFDSFVEFQKSHPLIDPARNFISQEHFITNIQPLRESLISLVANTLNADIGIYFEFLNTGANIAINEDTRFIPGSLIKMPTALAVMKKIQDGEWKLSNKLVLFEEDKNDGYGVLYKEKVGTAYTIEELLKELLIKSDDTAHRIFIRNMETAELREALSELGLEQLYDAEYNITVKEYSRIFRSLYTSSYLQREHSDYLLELLTQSNFDKFLGSGIPPDVSFSHKFGEYDPENTYLDSGIVYIPNRPYVLTVAIKSHTDQQNAEKLMYDISKQTYEYIKNF
jgi:beta-lactamase class A